MGWSRLLALALAIAASRVKVLPISFGVLHIYMPGRHPRCQLSKTHLPSPRARLRVDFSVHPNGVAHGLPACDQKEAT